VAARTFLSENDGIIDPAPMIIKLALFMWLTTFALMIFARAKARTWIARLALGGFCLLLLALFLRLLSRAIWSKLTEPCAVLGSLSFLWFFV